PYMGSDSVTPFLKFEGKWVILLAHTSNEGGNDFQLLKFEEEHLFEKVIRKANTWAGPDQLMYVVGATRPESFALIRKHAPDHFLLVPGVGAQGGNLQDVCKYGLNKDVGLLINSSRSIIYASNDESFAERAREEALKIQQEMAVILEQINL
ncbi:MAG TPA: orotidine 5'-phosphate decarboxylase / HUMPS family protein, partial [Daejeonella sp.]|nr:orotidine 5'-phosphate decarboxylase / HUMPS family protein [Daejeonella sp.]